MRKIAIPVVHNTVSPHFGHSTQFIIYEVENSNISKYYGKGGGVFSNRLESMRKIHRHFADNTHPHSLATRLRRRRLRIFLKMLRDLPRPISILDVGGRQQYWEMVGEELLKTDDLHVTLVNVEEQSVSHPAFTAVTGDDGKYEIRMPTGTYRLNIAVGKKSYGGSGSFKEEIPGKLWSLDFLLERKLSDQDFELGATPRAVLVKPVFTPRPTPRNKWAEFFTFLGAVIGIGALAD